MIKAFIASAVLFAHFAVAAHAATITAPKGGDVWVIGAKKTITWSGAGGGAGRLALWRTGAGKVGIIKSDVSLGAGSFAWTVGALEDGGPVTPAADYFVRLVKGDGTVLDKSPVFTIDKLNLSLASKLQVRTDLAPFGAIAVTSPANGAGFKPGEMINLSWSTAGLQGYPTVVLGVYLPDRKTFVGSVGSSQNPATSWPNSGSYEAPVFNERYQVGKQYVLRVATADQKHVGFSGVFSILPLTAVPVTEEVHGLGIYHLDFTKNEQNNFGCFYSKGTAGPPIPDFTHPVGVFNIMDDPAGPCWSATGHLYRTVATFEGLKQGWEVTKAELRFVPTQGVKQTLSVSVRESASNDVGAPLTGVASISAWGFGQAVSVDVTAAVQAWCTGKKANNGFLLAGEEGAWGDHNNAHIVTFVSLPKLFVTRTTYQ